MLYDAILESTPEFAPILAIEFVPTEDSGADEIGGVSIEEVGGVCLSLTLTGVIGGFVGRSGRAEDAHVLLFDKGKFAFGLVEEILSS